MVNEDSWRSGYDDWLSHNPADDYREDEEQEEGRMMGEDEESGEFPSDGAEEVRG